MFVFRIINPLTVICDSSPLFFESMPCLHKSEIGLNQNCVKFAEFSRSVLHDSGTFVFVSVICEMFHSKIFVCFLFFLYLTFIHVLAYVHACVTRKDSRLDQSEFFSLSRNLKV